LPFNKSIIMISSTRYEHGQEPPHQWRNFNNVLQKVAAQPYNVVGGNSVYDAEYISYFTGLHVTYIPSLCDQITARYNPTRHQFLMAHSHVPPNVNEMWPGGSLTWGVAMNALNEAKARVPGAESFEFVGISDLYGHYEYSDLASHRAMIHFPYQVSVMSFFEQYRMNLPLFVPSIEFLVELHLKYAILNERTWGRIRGGGQVRGSPIERHPRYPVPLDPNDEASPEALRYWLQFSDFYTKPHVQYFDSFEDLLVKLTTTDFKRVSLLMEQHNVHMQSRLVSQWRRILERITMRGKPEMPSTYEEGMKVYE
jgi:hypothetical protein